MGAPAKDLTFKIGWFIEGRGCRKLDIVDKTTLAQAYERASVDRRLTLWVDPHTREKSKGKRPANTVDDTNETAETKKSKREDNIEKNLEELKTNFNDKWPEFKLRAWATMVASGTHVSLEKPPDVAFFQTTEEKKATKNQPLEERVAAVVAATVAAVGQNNNQNNQNNNNNNKTSQVETRTQLIRQLKDLKDLLDSGVLDQTEYGEQKQKILTDLRNL